MRARRLGFTLIVALTACPADTAERPTPPPEVVRGGTLHVALAEDVDALDPHYAARPSSWFFARALHRGLLAFPAAPPPAGSHPVPDLAEELPEEDLDGTRYTFRLRGGVRFADGEPLTAADARASLQRLLRTGRGIAPFLSVIERIRTPDERTIVIRLSRRSADLAWILAHPQAAILPADTEAAGRAVAAPGPVGAGPYVLERYRPERDIVLSRNRAWRADPVRLAPVDRVEARITAGPAAAARRVREGDADLLLDPGPPDLGPVEREGARTVTVASGCIRYLFLNRRVAPFADRSVRRAVALALDREALPGVPDRAVPAGGLLPPGVDGHTVELDPYAPGRARELLAGSPAPGATIVVADSPRDRAEARAIRDALAPVGFEVRIERVAPALVLPLRYRDPAARTPMGIATWCADWPGLAGRNVLGSIADPRARRDRAPNPIFASATSGAVTDAIRRAERAPDAAAAQRWAAADTAVRRTAVLIPLSYPLESVLVSPRVRGLEGTPMFPRGDPTALWLDPAATAGS